MRKIHPLTWLLWLALFVLFLISPTDPDLGWHLRCGQQIWQDLPAGRQGQGWCNQNQFSVLLENYSWVNHYWLYQVGLWLVFRAAGLWGLTVLNALLMSLAFIFFYLAIKNYAWEKILATGLIIFLSWGVFSFGIRSQLGSLFFFSLLLWGRDRLALWPLVMFVWAQMHGGSAIMGLILLVFFRPSPAVLGLSLGATLLNPFGLGIYQEAWRHFAGVNLAGLIAEWVPPTPVLGWLVLTSGLGLGASLLFKGGLKNLPLALLISAFAFLALKARRNLPFYFLVSSFIFLRAPATRLVLAGWLKQKILRNNLAILTTAALLFFGLFVRLPETLALNSSWHSYCQNQLLAYPCQAVEFLKKQPRKGVIFNRYEWGGFLIWQLPEYKIFVDGRMPAWPARRSSGEGGPTSPYTVYLETLQNQPGWQETLKNYQINWILISPGTFMDLLLAPQPEKFGWRQAFRDKMAVVYQKI